MNFKKFLLILFFCYSCTTIQNTSNLKDKIEIDSFITNGFTLIYTDELKKNKIISKNLDSRSLIIFQKNLKKGKSVKITNLLNNRSLIVKVGDNSDYPHFYNSVISERIFKELEIDVAEPYVQIYELNQNSMFVAKKAKTFDEEKEVANKAPVEGISIKDLTNTVDKTVKNIKKNNFSYIIKIADFYFKETAELMKQRILDETNTKHVKIKPISSNSFRVYIGPFKDLNSLKNNFNTINKLNFENLELIKQ